MDTIQVMLTQILDSLAAAGAVPGEDNPPAVVWEYLLLIVGVMLLTGLLGGLAHALQAKKEERHYGRSIILGIVATLTIPLFLKIVDSNILAAGAEMESHNLLVFAGFCVLAAYFADRFLEGLSTRVLQDLKKKVEDTGERIAETQKGLQETAEKADLLLDTQMAPEKAVGKGGVDTRSLNATEFSDRDKVASAFGKNLETLDSLKEKCGLDVALIQKILTDMEKEGLLRKISHKGKAVYGRI